MARLTSLVMEQSLVIVFDLVAIIVIADGIIKFKLTKYGHILTSLPAFHHYHLE